jgi:hypothetical protein
VDGGGTSLRTRTCASTVRDVVDHDPALDWIVIRVDPEGLACVTLPVLGALATSNQGAE